MCDNFRPTFGRPTYFVWVQDSPNNLYVNSPTDTLIVSLNERGCANRIRIALIVYLYGRPTAQHVYYMCVCL